MKRRALTVNAALGAVVATEAASIAALALWPVGRSGWWPAAVITAVAGIALLVRVHNRNLVMWLADRVRWRHARRRTTPAGAAVDVSHGGAVYGVRTADHEAVTVIEVAGRPYSPTYLRGASLSLTRNVVPLDILIGLLDQPGGLRLGIDIVSDGFRVRRGTGYPQLYVTLLAGRGAAGHRNTYLVVRLDITESMNGLAYRRSIGAAAAAATERIVNELEQAGVRARPLSADEHDTVLQTLGINLACPPPRPAPEPDDESESDSAQALDDDDDFGDDALLAASGAPGRHRRAAAPTSTRPPSPALPTAPQQSRPKIDVGWNTIHTSDGFVTSYYFSPEDITTDTFTQMWSLPADHVVHMVSLRKPHRGPVLVSALVRLTTPNTPDAPPTLYLNPLPGDQAAAALRVAPTSTPRLALPTAPLTEPHSLRIAVGPTGILVGSALRDDPHGPVPVRRDDLVMLSLTDARHPTRIVMDTAEFYVRQLIIRAAAAGEKIAIYSRHPQHWLSVSQPNITIAEPGRPAEFVPSIIVNDRAPLAPPSVFSSTVITVGSLKKDATEPDIMFEQTSQSTVRITTKGSQLPLDVAMVVFRQEQTWTG